VPPKGNGARGRGTNQASSRFTDSIIRTAALRIASCTPAQAATIPCRPATRIAISRQFGHRLPPFCRDVALAMIATSHCNRQKICLAESVGRPCNWLCNLFGVDVRALAAMRVGMSLVLLADLAGRAVSLRAHYTDAGILPRTARIALTVDGGLSCWSSLHMASGSAWFQAALFMMAAFFACCLLVGYRSRPATAASWLLLVSLQARNPLVLEAGDVLVFTARRSMEH
jgi:hypothetical protein